jgi:hypothetical protein
MQHWLFKAIADASRTRLQALTDSASKPTFSTPSQSLIGSPQLMGYRPGSNLRSPQWKCPHDQPAFWAANLQRAYIADATWRL